MTRVVIILITCCLICLQAIEGSAQCDLDRHNTSPHTGWLSCDVSSSPNKDRGESIWIEYDLGVPHVLNESWIWNYNAVSRVDQGITELVIDYRSDGEAWTELGIYTIDLSSGSSLYAGTEGPDFGGVTAQYVLLTALDNGGGACYGLAEWKIEAEVPVISALDEVKGEEYFDLYPSPASDRLNLVLPNDGREYTVEVRDLLGQRVLPSAQSTLADSQSIDVSTLVEGVYSLCIVRPDARYCHKFSVFRE